MKIQMLGSVLVMLVLAAPAQATLELQLTTRLSEQLPYLHPDMRLAVVNTSPEGVLFPANAFHVLLYLKTEDGWWECRPFIASRPAPLTSIDWHPVEPGQSFPVSIPPSRCAEGEGTWFEWANEPGTHHVKAKITTYAHKVGVPEGAFDGALESNVLEFRIKEPSGVDAEAIAWAKGSPMKVDLLDEFPTSEYAAFFVYGKSRQIEKLGPAETRSLIARGLYPGPNSVPGDNAWRSLNSEDYARWQVEWGKRVLRQHPRFAFHDELKTSVALAQMSLGQRDEALSTLEKLANKKDSEAAQWARAFLGAGPERTDCRETDEGEND